MSALPSLSPAPSAGCRLVTVDGRALPFQGGELSVDAAAGLARVTLRQRFVNPHPEPLRVTYKVPLPPDAAVSGFAFVLDGQRIVGQVDTRRRARERFEEALIEGRTAALLEEDRSSLFTQEVGNVPPGATVECELILDQKLRWHGGRWEWRFPTVVAPRYQGAEGRVADSARVSVDVADGDPGARIGLLLVVRDGLTGAVESPSHALFTHAGTGQGAEVSLSREGGAALDRDVVVRWPVAQPQPGARLEVGRAIGGSEIHGLLTLVPPATVLPAVPRDLIVLLDTSGSMGGAPLSQAQAVTCALIESLTAQDSLQLIEFSSRPRAWQSGPVAANDSNRAQALAWVRALRAGGGTEMRDGILAALSTIRGEAQRQVILITDGLIGFEQEIIRAILERLPQGSRVHSVGVGSSTNRTLLSGAARAGGGVEAIVDLSDDPRQAADLLVAATASPQVVNLRFSGEALLHVDQHRLPDLMAGRPTRLAVRLRPQGGRLFIHGETAQGTWQQALEIPPMAEGQGNLAVVKYVGRVRVDEQELRAAVGESVDAQVEALGLAYQIATRKTSWIAVSDTATVDPTRPTRQEVVPQALPHGMSAAGLGLRPAAPPSPLVLGVASTSTASVLAAPGSAGGALPPAPAPAMRAMQKEAPSDGPVASLDFDDAEEAEESEGTGALYAPSEAPLRDQVKSESAPKRRLLAYERREASKSKAAPVSISTAPVAPRPPLVLLGRVVLARFRQLVLELTVGAEGLDWGHPVQAWVVLTSGQRLSVTVVAGQTTQPGALSAGQVVRVALQRLGLGWQKEDVASAILTLPGGQQVTVTLH